MSLFPSFRPKVNARADERRKLNQTGMTDTAIAREIGINKGTIISDILFLSEREGKEISNTKWGRAKWIKAIDAINKEDLPYFNSKDVKPSLRTIFYRLSSKGYINKTEHDYDNLCTHTVQARLGKVDRKGDLLYPELPVDCFTDETRTLLDHYSDRKPVEPEDKDKYINRMIEQLKNAPNFYNGQGTRGGHWYNQPEYVEVWKSLLLLQYSNRS